jgi:hypothetical protein
MGAWGFKALESDEGLDVVDFLKDHIPNDLNFKLSEMIFELKGELLAETFEKEDIDFLYDTTAIAIAELYFMFKDTGELDYDDDNNEKSLKNIKTFTANKESLEYILKYLMDIKNEVPDKDGEREIVILWRASKHWKEWEDHLNELIKRMDDEIKKIT